MTSTANPSDETSAKVSHTNKEHVQKVKDLLLTHLHQEDDTYFNQLHSDDQLCLEKFSKTILNFPILNDNNRGKILRTLIDSLNISIDTTPLHIQDISEIHDQLDNFGLFKGDYASLNHAY